MRSESRRSRSALRQFTMYAAVTLLPVLALGAGLALSFRSISQRHGLSQGRTEALLIAQTAVEPQLDARPLSAGLTPRERAGLERLVHRALTQGRILRLRLRDLRGRVVFSDDGTGFGGRVDDEAADAADGEVVARLTHLNADGNDEGDLGQASVEVYLPLSSPGGRGRIGVLEIYLPYAAIAADVDAALHSLYIDLGAGLAALYLALFLITLSVSRGLRREVAINAFLARHDTLTDLPNRAAFLEHARAAVAGAGGARHPVALAFIDLDHFKDINDTLGHQSGDELLTKLAVRVREHMRPDDTVARMGGDEFGLILRDAGDPQQVLERLRGVISDEVEIRGLTLSVEPSIGFVTVSDPDADVDVLLQHADVAMYAAKAGHAGVAAYRPDLDHYDADSLGLVGELRGAIADGQLVLHCQPQLDLATGRVTAVEALVRWQHPVHGLLYPDRFLPSAEQTDAIYALTDWVLATALREAARLDAAGTPLAVAVNVSARSIVRSDFAPQVVAALAEAGVPAGRLIVEVTETALLTDPARATRVLGDLAAAGVRVSLDDFGRGQTSLAYLSALPLDEIKIDRSFVSDMRENPAHSAIVRSVVDLGHNLGIRVVAEGIETADVLEDLRAEGCDLAQGYHVARPMPVESLDGWLSGVSGSRSAAVSTG